MIKIEEIREKRILNTINKVLIKNKKTFKSIDGMCKVASNYISCDLFEEGVNNKIINTKELGCRYEHEFVLVKLTLEKLVIIDITFSQFLRKEINFYNETPVEKLEKNKEGKQISYNLQNLGYSVVKKEEFHNFVNSFNIKKLALAVDKR